MGFRRGKTFGEQWMEENFREEHERAFPEKDQAGKSLTPLNSTGHPDQGTGWYSQRLPLSKWNYYLEGVRVH